MYRQNFFDNFEFEDQDVVHQKIEPKRFFKNISLIFEGHEQLPLYWDQAQVTLALEAFAVDTLDQTGSLYSMNLDCRPNCEVAPGIRAFSLVLHPCEI